MHEREVIIGEFGPEPISLDVDDSEEFGCGCEDENDDVSS